MTFTLGPSISTNSSIIGCPATGSCLTSCSAQGAWPDPRFGAARRRGRSKRASGVRGPLMAPVSAGMQVGSFQVLEDHRVVQEKRRYTAQDVGRGPLYAGALDAISELTFGQIL